MARFDDAVAELYQAPLGSFVTERKRLAGALKEAGDKAGAAKLAKLNRPTMSAWAVNQLWWHARDAFEDLLSTADKLRKGKLDAAGAHREAIAKLRARAQRMLDDAGHSANEATLRRVTQTLSAIAVSGWDPDPPGALAADRDPPGFEAIGIVGPAEPADEQEETPPPKKKEPAKKHDDDDKPSRNEIAEARKRKEEAEAEERALAAAERKRIEEERARIKAEKHRLEAALRTAKAEVHVQEREVMKLRKQLEDAEDSFEQAKAVAEDLEAKLDELDN